MECEKQSFIRAMQVLYKLQKTSWTCMVKWLFELTGGTSCLKTEKADILGDLRNTQI